MEVDLDKIKEAGKLSTVMVIETAGNEVEITKRRKSNWWNRSGWNNIIGNKNFAVILLYTKRDKY